MSERYKLLSNGESVCGLCGCVVYIRGTHDAWHDATPLRGTLLARPAALGAVPEERSITNAPAGGLDGANPPDEEETP